MLDNPSNYDFRAEVVEDTGFVRELITRLRSASPAYAQQDEFVEYLRDLRLIVILIWVGLFLGGLWLVADLSGRLQKQLSTMSKSIQGLVENDLSQTIKIAGNSDVLKVGEQLEQLRLRLDRNEQQQVQFLQHVSHEIKTPLASIREGIKLMNDELLGSINADQAEVTQIILKNSRELQSSIESLLDYNQALVAPRESERERVDLCDLIEHAIARQTLGIKAKGLEINKHLIPAEVCVNQAQILTVLDNLLSNAIRFSPSGGRIHLELHHDNQMYHLLVQDEGPGIPDDQRNMVFSAFFVGTSKPKNSLKGTGLGLSIAREYVELHRGAIEALDPDDGPLSGALFRVCLVDN